MTLPTVSAFRSRLSPPTAQGCLEWEAARNNRGYGVITYWDSEQHKRRSMGAHRMAYIIHNPGVSLTGIIMHTCDNPACCNPDHLVQGTCEANTQDMLAKGRHSRSRKFAPRQRKLTDAMVRAIRHLAETTEHTALHIAMLFDVSEAHVRAICSRTRKGHVSDEGPMADIPATYARAKKAI